MLERMDIRGRSLGWMVAVVYAETFGNPSEVWMWRQVRALGAPLVTHEHRNPETFPCPEVHVVPKRRAFGDRVRAGIRRLRSGHGYRLPAATERAVARTLAGLGATLVHAHYGPAGLRIAPLAPRLVVTFHGFDATRLPLGDASYRRALPGLFRKAHRVIAVSQAIRERLLALGCADPVVLPIGVPLRPPRPLRAASPAPRAITVARLHPAKGVPDLVDAVARTPLSLDVVGDGEERAEVEARVRRHGLADRVRLHGTLAPDRVAALLDAADLFVLNSRTPEAGDTEGLPVSVLEAMEASLPVVATRLGGIPEAVADGETGILVPERDTDALARALGTLARDPALRARLGAAGRARVEERFDLEACTRRLRELLA